MKKKSAYYHSSKMFYVLCWLNLVRVQLRYYLLPSQAQTSRKQNKKRITLVEDHFDDNNLASVGNSRCSGASFKLENS